MLVKMQEIAFKTEWREAESEVDSRNRRQWYRVLL